MHKKLIKFKTLVMKICAGEFVRESLFLQERKMWDKAGVFPFFLVVNKCHEEIETSQELMFVSDYFSFTYRHPQNPSVPVLQLQNVFLK